MALTGMIAFIAYPEFVARYIVDPSVFRITYQFLLVSVLGGAIAYLYKLLELGREQRRYLREMHKELLDAFNKAKMVRRELRARLGTKDKVNPAFRITAEEYEKQMARLGESQLVFEVYAKRALDQGLWFKGAHDLGNALDELERYLNKILKEYQEKLVIFNGDPPDLEIDQLEYLVEFIGPYTKKSSFEREFKFRIRDALGALGSAGLK
jgi:hypothetical protein